MANILEKYGVKEVADVFFYEIGEDGGPAAPVLYLDTLKVSTIEQTAEEAEAKGGKGNSSLIVWDYGREITLTLEDALFSMKSMAVMFGSSSVAEVNKIRKTIPFVGATVPSTWTGPGEVKYPITSPTIYDLDGEEVDTPVAGEEYYATFDVDAEGLEVVISAANFPGTYYIVGDTFARSHKTGQDEFFQFVIPKGKVQSENTITMEAEGDPSTFSMNVRVLRPESGAMMKLLKYGVTDTPAG